MLRRALGELAMAGRLARDLPAYLRRPLTPEQAVAIVRRRLETRADRFLALAERANYRHPRSPYLRLLRAAGCELGDLRALVEREGLEGALQTLAERGVYVSFDEFKGRREVVRGSSRFSVTQVEFRNPGLTRHFERRTGRTRGGGVSVYVSLRFVAEQAVNYGVALGAHGLSGAAQVFWLTAPIYQMLRYAKLEPPPIAWFYPLAPLPWKVRAVGRFLEVYSRLLGRPLPGPVHCGLEDAPRFVRLLASCRGAERPLAVTTYASSAVRAALAARDLGLPLVGITFITIGEPFTRGKQRTIEAAGARATATYGSTETPTIGFGCATPRESDDMHFFADNYALVVRSRPIDGSGLPVDALMLTTLLDSSPEVWLNVENGDHATLEQRACDCLMGTLGLDRHLVAIGSHEKLTGQGMTFARTRITQVLEEALPDRFGGTAADYQVLEEEDEHGIARLSLLVDPRIGPIDEAGVKQTFLAELGRGGELEGYMAEIWRRAGTVEIRRASPLATPAGKILPFHLVKRGRP